MEEGAPVCYCVPDYHGERCELQYDECQLGPRCMNGGVCIDGVDDYSCSCPPGMTGRLCECLIVGDDEIDCNYTLTLTTTARPPSETTTPVGHDTTIYTTGSTFDTTYVPKSTDKPVFTTFSYKTSEGAGTTLPGTTVTSITTTAGVTSSDQTTEGSRLTSKSFQASTTTPFSSQTFRTGAVTTELPYSTVSSPDSTDLYTDTSTLVSTHHTTEDSYTSRYSPSETTTESRSETDFTRFSTRPTPGHLTTHEPTQPVPTDAPDHITHFFTEFPLYFTTTTTTPSGVSVSTDTPRSDTTTSAFTEVPTVPTTHYLSSSTTGSTETPFVTVTTQRPVVPTIRTTSVTTASTDVNYTESPDCAKITCLNGGTCVSSSINGTKVSV